MFNLIIKDISIQKKDKTVFYFLIFNLFSAFILSKNYGISIFLTFISIYLLTVYANAYDFKYKGEMMINSMPVNRNIIVIGKYLSVFIYFLCAAAITFIGGYTLKILGVRVMKVGDLNIIIKGIDLNIILIEFFIVSIYYSIFFPIYFKFGYLKSRWANFLAMILIGALIGIINEIANGKTESTKNMYSSFFKGGVTQDFMIIGISMIFLLVSILISKKIYFDKEF